MALAFGFDFCVNITFYEICDTTSSKVVDTKSLTATECNSMTSTPYVENGEFDDITKLKKEEKT